MMIAMDHGGCRHQQSLKTTLGFLDLGFVEGFGFFGLGVGCGLLVVVVVFGFNGCV